MDRIHAVTAEIESGRLSDRKLVEAYLRRAEAFDDLTIDPHINKDGYSEAAWRYSSDNRDGAIADYTRALELDPENIDALAQRAGCHADRAEAAYNHEDYLDAAADYGRAAADVETAARLGRHAGETADDLTVICFWRGRALAAAGEHGRALECYDRAISINYADWGPPPVMVGYRGDSWAALGKAEKAVDDWLSAFRWSWREEAARWTDRFEPQSTAARALRGGQINDALRLGLGAYAQEWPHRS